MKKVIKILIGIVIVGALAVLWVLNPGNFRSRVIRTKAQAEKKARGLVKTTKVTQKAKDDARVCRENLRRIQRAKRKAEQRKGAMQPVSWDEVLPHLNNQMPRCPSGGTYKLNPPVQVPSCSVGGRGTVTTADDHMILD